MMQRNTFSDEKVRQRLAGFVPLKIDVDKQPKLAARYGIEGMHDQIGGGFHRYFTGHPLARPAF